MQRERSTKLCEASSGLARPAEDGKCRRALAALQRQGDELAPRVGAFWFSKDGPLCDGQSLFGVSLAEMVLDEEVCDFALGVALVALVQGEGQELGKCGVDEAVVVREDTHARERVDRHQVFGVILDAK